MDEPSWQDRLEVWLEPFLERLGHKAQRRWAPVYLHGLLGPGDRKSLEPMAERVAPGEAQQLHHFLATSPWSTAPLEEELVRQADALVGGPDAVLVKPGRHSVGVARQYCGQLGKTANCQVLVSLTLARREVPVCVGLRLFLPQRWGDDADRRRRARGPADLAARPKWQMALDELDRIRAAGARFGWVVADAAYGKAAAFRQGLETRGLRWAVGSLPTQSADPEGLPGRRAPHTDHAQGHGAAAQASPALAREPQRGRHHRCPPRGGVPGDHLAPGHQGTFGCGLRGPAGAGRRWAAEARRPAPARTARLRMGTASITSPTILTIRLWRPWPATSRRGGCANKPISR